MTSEGQEKLLEPTATATAGDKEESESEGEDLKKAAAGKDYQMEEVDYHPDARLERFPMRFFRIAMPGGGDLYFNHVTSLFGFICLWAFSAWCMADPEAAKVELRSWKAEVSSNFTWFYIAANPSFTFFVLWLAIRYGNVKLGKKHEEPEFSDLSYFAMLFSAGVAVGLFVCTVASDEEKTAKCKNAPLGSHIFFLPATLTFSSMVLRNLCGINNPTGSQIHIIGLKMRWISSRSSLQSTIGASQDGRLILSSELQLESLPTDLTCP